VLTARGRLARGPLPLAAATALLTGCTDEPTPPAPSSTSAPVTSSPPVTSSAPATTRPPTSSPTKTATSVAEAYRAARTASLSAQSGHAKGFVTREGTRLGVDVEGLANGSNQTVFISTLDGGTAEVLTVGDDYWVGGDEAYWASTTGDAENAAKLVGRYAPITESDATELGTFTLRSLLTHTFSLPELTVLESDTGEATGTEVDGQPAFVLGREGGARMWVAADGSGTLLRVVGPPADPSDLTFSGWERARTFTQPAPGDLLEN